MLQTDPKFSRENAAGDKANYDKAYQGECNHGFWQ